MYDARARLDGVRVVSQTNTHAVVSEREDVSTMVKQ